jgi:hypothetical protein
MKGFLIESFNSLRAEKIIKPDFQVIFKDESFQHTDKLAPLMITKSKEIRFYEIVSDDEFAF